LNEKGPLFGGQTGIETGSPRLSKENMLGKCRPFNPEDWPDVVVNAFEVLAKNHWVPCATLILGLPAEEEEDINLTIDLVEKLKGFKSLIVPLFLVSMGGLKDKAEPFTLERMTTRHSELFLKCREHNFHWIPTFIDNYLENGGMSRRGIKLLLSYGIKYSEDFIQECQNHYNYALRCMIRILEVVEEL